MRTPRRRVEQRGGRRESTLPRPATLIPCLPTTRIFQRRRSRPGDTRVWPTEAIGRRQHAHAERRRAARRERNCARRVAGARRPRRVRASRRRGGGRRASSCVGVSEHARARSSCCARRVLLRGCAALPVVKSGPFAAHAIAHTSPQKMTALLPERRGNWLTSSGRSGCSPTSSRSAPRRGIVEVDDPDEVIVEPANTLPRLILGGSQFGLAGIRRDPTRQPESDLQQGAYTGTRSCGSCGGRR